MKSYKSFEQILTESEYILKDITNLDHYYAHKRMGPDGIEFEPLKDHVDLVIKIALELIEAHDIEEILNNIIARIDFDDFAVGNFIKRLFINAIVFHDFGKVNPNFQNERMGNSTFKPDTEIVVGSQHSFISAIIFISHHAGWIKENFTTKRRILMAYTFLFSIPILKHHSKYIEKSNSLSEIEKIHSIWHLIEMFGIPFYTQKVFENQEKHLDALEKITENNSAYFFNLFLLLKMCWSILTAADFYATSEYMNGFEISNFGLIDENLRTKMVASFRSYKYNKILYDESAKHLKVSFEKLNRQSKENLNILRSKLAYDTITAIRKHHDSKLFYLEAPTGSGKTNLSMGIATELLEADSKINKVFYVFPFTTLITQSFESIKQVLNLNNKEIIQLHSKSGFHLGDRTDGIYGERLKKNYLRNLFINYPVTLLSHIKFFSILKGNSKENNYILHRLANSVVIIDELQTYNPKHWDKVILFIKSFSEMLNIRFILMSATLPKIDELLDSSEQTFIRLLPKEIRNKYFQNINFKGRVHFDFSFFDKKNPIGEDERTKYLEKLKGFVLEKSGQYAKNNRNKVKVIIEFIKKKSASKFLKIIQSDSQFSDYQIYLISGEILDPRRRQIIREIKNNKYEKVILISTQVVEAGVDIDMDLGFKDSSLIDSDEQLAGRVNRNASKQDAKVYIFNFDREAIIYGTDKRYKVSREEISIRHYRHILLTKDFDLLYRKVIQRIKKGNKNIFAENIESYKRNFSILDFRRINSEFRLIEESNDSVFVPLKIPFDHFEQDEQDDLKALGILPNCRGDIDGELVWDKYVNLFQTSAEKKKTQYIEIEVKIKRLFGIVSKFMFSVFPKQFDDLVPYSDGTGEGSFYDRLGILYLLNWKDYNGLQIYTYEGGVDVESINSDNFL